MKRQPAFHFLVFLFCWLFLFSQPCYGATASTDVAFARDGEHIVVACALHIAPEYHAYAHTPGDTGRPATFSFSVDLPYPQKIPVYYPEGQQQQDYYEPMSTVFVYKNQAIFFALLPKDNLGTTYTGTLDLLLCSPHQCIPLTLPVQGKIPTSVPDITEVSWTKLWYKAKQTDFHLANQKEPVSTSAGLGEIPSLQPRYDDTGMEVHSFWKALCFGLLAGLLLNLMPCVLPVISLKASTLLAHNTHGNEFRTLRMQNVYFSVGILFFFTMLAIVLGTSGVFWGQLFQSQFVVLCLLFTIFSLSLSTFGAFNLPIIDLKIVRETQHPQVKAFLTGVLATTLATPCSGPFLGGVLAWTYTQPLSVIVVIFWAIGLGMAIPYLVLAWFPAISRFFPKPGPWLWYFEKCMAFLLLASALYLLALLPENLYIPTLFLLLLEACLLGLYGHLATLAASNTMRRGTAILCLAVMVAGITWLSRPHVLETVPWQDFSSQQFSSMLGRQAMFLEFTAEWCPNCKFLEKTVLTPERLNVWYKDFDVKFIKVDISAPDAPGLALLEQLGSKSIPLAALFPAGVQAQQPLVIRDVYGGERLEKALSLVFGGQ